MTREFEADFSTGSVQDASFTARPDAIVGRIALAPGPVALQDLVDGLLAKAWYARYDNTAGKVYLAASKDDTRLGWSAEVELFTYTGDDIVALSLAFDATGRPVVAMERNGNLWVRYYDGDAYQLTNTGAGISPALLHQNPDSAAWRVLFLLYESGSDIVYRVASDDYATSRDSLSNLATDQRIERSILDSLNRVHLILSTRTPATGRYALSRISSDYIPPCMDVSGLADRIDDGIQTIFIWTDDGELLVTCELDLDVLIIAAGGDSGGSDGDDTVFWASLGGVALDPDTDVAPAEHRAFGGGAGAPDDRNGNNGGSGGGGGGKSPSGNSMFTVGGGRIAGQGNAAGGGRSTWGILSRKTAASGGGGGYGTAGKGGTSERAGKAGLGAVVPGWNWYGPRGGRGYRRSVEGPTTEGVTGGGGSGGVLTVEEITIQPAQAIPIRVGLGAGGDPGGNAGVGGASIGGPGLGGMVAIRVNTAAADTPAVLSGGVEIVDGGYRYHIFTSSGTIVVSTPGSAEVLVVGGGAGGGSDCGSGGGGGDVRISTVNFVAPSEAVTVGAGGAAGVAGAAGANGGDSSVGTLSVAFGGGAGAGEGTAAGNRATGGGGHGVEGDPGVGSPLRGYPGGDGGGFDLSAGGSSAAAGGGGGAGGPGDVGAELETQGLELAADWDASTSFQIDVALQVGDETSSNSRALLSKNVSRGEMFTQVRVKLGHNSANAGPAARASHPSGVDAAPDGHWCWVNKGNNRFGLDGAFTAGGGIALGVWYTLQLYVADSLQQAHLDNAGFEVRLDSTDATYDGQNTRSAGMRSIGGSAGVGRRRFDDFMCFRTKYITVGGIPTGGKAQVLNSDDVLVAEADESSGEAIVDCSRFGDGATGVDEPVPLSGWQTLRVLNAALEVVAELSTTGIFPGGEFDVSGAALEIRIDSSGAEPVPIDGLIEQELFTRLTPGPDNGDGGVGREIDVAWLVAAAGDDGVFGGGGGGGAELFVSGQGGDGGGGDGSVDTASPTAGTDETGGGGGGSGDVATAGAAGGDGIVVLRTVI